MLGSIIGTVFKISMVATRKLAAPLASRPVLRCTALGLVLGLVGMALPLTLFLGTDGLVDVTSDPAALGAGLILVSALVKILATTGALSFGFVGGPIFPLLFVGGSFGTVIHLAIDGIPLGLAVVAMMVAVPSSVIPVPLSIATLTVLIAGIPPSESTSVFVAAIVAMIAGRLIETMLPKPAEAHSRTVGQPLRTIWSEGSTIAVIAGLNTTCRPCSADFNQPAGEQVANRLPRRPGSSARSCELGL